MVEMKDLVEVEMVLWVQVVSVQVQQVVGFYHPLIYLLSLMHPHPLK
jgi:hypothetical protein